MTRRAIFIGATIVGLAALTAGGIYVDGLARIAAAYKAKALCSEIFLAGRNKDAVLENEFKGISPAIDNAGVRIDDEEKSVRAALFGLGAARASYRDGYGCTIESGGAPAPLPSLKAIASEPWQEAPPVSGQAIARIDYAEIDHILDQAMEDAAAAHRAFVVAVDGKIVAERYANGFSVDTPFLSWSMAKSVTATLVGAAAFHRHLDIDNAAPVPEWRGDAAKSKITWNDLLRMQSGLAFTEHYADPTSDVNKMLFRARDAGEVAAMKKVAYAPGEQWYYSSGTSNLIARTLRQVLAERGVDYQVFAREALFGLIGAASFTLETDSAGNSVGSSYIYATARDWARLGELYLKDGVWNGVRLLPEGWSDYVSAPTPASDGEYGAHFWLNHDGENGRARWLPGLPKNVYYMAGHEGQYVFIIPDKRAVIVRTGLTRSGVPIEVVAPVVAGLYRAIGEPSDDDPQ